MIVTIVYLIGAIVGGYAPDVYQMAMTGVVDVALIAAFAQSQSETDESMAMSADELEDRD